MKKRIANTAGTAAKRIMPQFTLSRVKALTGAKCHSGNVCIFSRNRSARHAVTAVLRTKCHLSHLETRPTAV